MKPEDMPALLPSASAIRAQLQAGIYNVETLINRLLETIERHEPAIGAWEWIDPERARRLARESDQRYARGQAGPLEGIPFGVKDVIDTAGIPTGYGSPVFEDHVPSQSATLVTRLEQAGALMLGKAVTTEFATQCPGKTRNPWNIGHTPGGSSSGSAAAVAAGFVPIALGTQTRASTIRPAAFCGVVGYKPSIGALPMDGVFPTSGTLDHAGFFAPAAVDLPLLMAAYGTTTAGGSLIAPPAPRVAFVRSPYWSRCDAVQRQCLEETARRLAEAGAAVVEAELPAAFEHALETINCIQRYELVQLHQAKIAEWDPQLSPQFKAYLEEGRSYSDAQYQAALREREALIALYDEFMRPYTVILTPPAIGEAPQGIASTGDATLCAIWTLCGAPCVALPARLSPGRLPLGIQLVGARNDDAALLAASIWCESAMRANLETCSRHD